MKRILLATLLAAVFAAPSAADVLIVKKGKGFDILGLKSKSESDVEITIENWKAFVDESTGVVEREGYDAVWFKKTARGSSKAVRYSIEDVVDIAYTTEPDNLLDGYDFQSTGAWGQAIGAFRAVVGDANVRPVYRVEADFQIGLSYLKGGSYKQALGHFAKWDKGNSKYTPQVYRIVAEILTVYKKFDQARIWYRKIPALDGIPNTWKFRARLGEVMVDIKERKYKEAETNAQAIARETGGNARLNDARALALALRGQAIREAGDAARLPEAQQVLEQAVQITGVSDTNMALAYSQLGDVIYAQGKPEAARYPYMRVVTLYPNESNYVANALLNAGQCFLDMSMRVKDDQAKQDQYLVHGMKLLAECAGRHRGSTPARNAATTYRKNKAMYEEALKRLGQ